MRITQLNSNRQNNLLKLNFQHSDTKVENTVTPEVETVRNKKNTASSITIASFALIITALMLSKGVQKNASKYLYQFKEYLSKKQELSSLNNSKRKTQIYDYSIKKINSFIKKTDSINNITSLKDILFMRLMYKTNPTRKIHEGITNFFEKISRKTILDSYKQTEKNLKIMNTAFEKLDEQILKNHGDEIVEYKGEKCTKRALVKRAKGHRADADAIVKAFLSKGSLDFRYEYIKGVTSDLNSKFWDLSFKDFWSKNNKFKRKEMWQTFIAAEQIKGDKTLLEENVFLARNVLSYSNTDRSEQIYHYIKELDNIILPNDKRGLELISRLEWYSKHPEAIKEDYESFLSTLAKLEKYKISGNNKDLVRTQERTKNLYIRLIRDLANEHAIGYFQDMLSIYYKIAPFDLDKSGASLAVKRAVHSFDKSVNLECVEFFDKVRDLRLGSAPTDVLTIIFSAITLSLGLGYAKDKDSRKSVMLKSGIPIIGGIATATYTATKLVSGGKSLALGFLSGIILNRLGVIADNMRKNGS